MPDYASSLLGMIDERARAGEKVVTKMGTVQSRESVGARVMVAMDGSSGAPQPVKCFENVIVDAGDRVGLVKFEGDWIIAGNYTLRTLGSASSQLTFSSLVSTTSATYVDMPSSPSLSVVKWRDSTQFRLRLITSGYAVTSGGTVVKVAYRLQTGGGVVDYDQDVGRFDYSNSNAHHTFGAIVTTAATLPAGLYTMTARWLRLSGSGSPTVDAQDLIHMEAEEVIS